jgi:hypothetical protein
MTECGNCGTRQGPFERVRFGARKLDRSLIVCAHGSLDKDGHGIGTLACLARRDANDRERWGGRGEG